MERVKEPPKKKAARSPKGYASFTTGRPFKPAASKAVPGRVVSVLPLDVAEALDALANVRFGGNRTAALASAVRLAVLVYGAAGNRDRLIRDERDALAGIGADVGTRAGK